MIFLFSVSSVHHFSGEFRQIEQEKAVEKTALEKILYK
jgi:hypothetical protein